MMPELTAFVDGGSHGNPGPAGVGLVITDDSGHRVEISESIGRGDNNFAEYSALLYALKYAVRNEFLHLHVFSDSEVVVKQMNGHYACHSPGLRQIYELCTNLISSLERFSIAHIRREKNAHANRLANDAILRAKGQKSEALLAEK
jgi:ribonuclease HI